MSSSRGPDDQGGAERAPARPAVRLVVAPVDAEPGSVVLAHRVNRAGIVERTLQVCIGVRVHPARVDRIPGIGVVGDEPFGRLRGLAEEEPVPPFARELRVGPREGLSDRNAIHHDQVGDGLRPIHCEAKRNVRAAVVSDDRQTGSGRASA